MEIGFTQNPASTFIFFLTIAISLITLYMNQNLLHKLVMRPYEVAHNGKWFTMLSSGFVHQDIYHLAFNMFTFYFFAFNFESYIGSLNFLIVYLLSIVLSDLPSLIKHKDNPNYGSLGASGAVSAVLFGSILYNPMAKMLIFPIPIPIPAFLFGGLYLAYCYYAGKKSYDNINHSAHFWGAVAGIALTAILDPLSIKSFFYFLF